LVASVVIPARNAAATLPATLAGLERQVDPPAFEVFVVDDGSDDATVELARASRLGVEVLTTAGGEGPAAARNLGCRAARGEVLVFVDADCDPADDWLRRLVDATHAAELVQGAVLPPEGARIEPFDRFLAVSSEYGLYQTANLAIKRELFERIGGFESIVKPEGGKELGEDAWLAWRARRAGARSAFAPDALVRHVVFPRDAGGYLDEQSRVQWFPTLVKLMPELRAVFLYRRWFLSHRSARFDLALAALTAAVATRRVAPLVATAPYLEEVWSASGAWGPARRAEVAPVHMAADVVRLVALVRGSLRERCPVL
jgi:glycosyltransferase involved in cell wall biosynthesis